MFPFGYSENAVCYQFSILSAKKHIAALALLRCSIIVKDKHNSSLVIALNCSPSNLLPERWGFFLPMHLPQ